MDFWWPCVPKKFMCLKGMCSVDGRMFVGYSRLTQKIDLWTHKTATVLRRIMPQLCDRWFLLYWTKICKNSNFTVVTMVTVADIAQLFTGCFLASCWMKAVIQRPAEYTRPGPPGYYTGRPYYYTDILPLFNSITFILTRSVTIFDCRSFSSSLRFEIRNFTSLRNSCFAARIAITNLLGPRPHN